MVAFGGVYCLGDWCFHAFGFGGAVGYGVIYGYGFNDGWFGFAELVGMVAWLDGLFTLGCF